MATQLATKGTLRAGALNVGGGTTISKRTLYTPTLSPAQVAANTTAEQTFTVAGVVPTDVISSVSKPTAQAGLGIVGWRVSAADQIAITFSNNTASPITPTAGQVYKVLVESM